MSSKAINVMLTPVRTVADSLRAQLTPTLRQEIADKLWTLERHFKGDGKGLSNGMVVEQTVFEIFQEHIDSFRVEHHQQSDCAIMDRRLSFKKVTGKSQLALQWSKNPAGFCGAFEHPILLLNAREGQWWRRKAGFDRHLPAGFFLVDDAFCNAHVCLKRNNKSDSLIDCPEVYAMLVSALDADCVVTLPPARDVLTFSFNHGFVARELTSKWPTLSYDATRPRFADLFAGAGGFHYALTTFLDGRCVFACDVDAACRDTYRDNFGVEPDGDIRDIAVESIPTFDILCAGFPCQPFSKAGNQLGFEDKTKGTLFHEIIRILRHHQPRALLLENVAHIVTHDDGNTWRTIRQQLVSVGYPMAEKPLLLSPLHFGAPQSRPRAFLVGIRNGMPPPFPTPALQPTNIRSILCSGDDLPRLTGTLDAAGRLWEDFCARLRTRHVAIPHFPIWTDDWDSTDVESPRYVRYRAWIDKNRAFYHEHQPHLDDWLQQLRATLPTAQALRKLEWQCDATSLHECLWTFRPSGLRVRNLDYSPTLVAMSHVPVYGPEWRFLTPREVCRLQDFPDTHRFRSARVLMKQMGNAVSVRVAGEVAQWLWRHAGE